jgi:abhydrolase domain-containing protein 13
LENTFLSISSMVDSLMPFLTYLKPLVLRIEWNNERDIALVSHPILFIAGQQDELVPHTHMKTLHARATKSRRAVWLPIPNGTHNDTWLRGGDLYFDKLRQFLESLAASPSSSDTCSTDQPSPPVDAAVLGSTTQEGAIPNMLQQPILGSIMKKDKSKEE